VDAVRGTLRYTNAGHNYPLLRRADGSIVELKEGGLPLGIVDGKTYEQGECAFSPNDSLLLYSDGLSEAIDARREMFGEERLRVLWSERGHESPASVIDTLFSAVETFRGRQLQSDDMTLVVVGPYGA